jgi:hypothetical protein
MDEPEMIQGGIRKEAGTLPRIIAIIPIAGIENDLKRGRSRKCIQIRQSPFR